MSQPHKLARQERALKWRRDHVLECAERIFARKGFHEATMQEIAREADYATGTLYTLFESKEALFAAIVEQGVPEIEAHLKSQIERGGSARDKIEHFVRGFFEFFQERKHLFQIYVNVTGGFLYKVKAEMDEQAFQSHQSFLTILESIFKSGMRSGEIRRDLEPRLLAVSLAGILTAVATDWITRAPERPFGEHLEETQRLVSALIAAPARTKRPG